jgi:calcineurin-like phosphoesterase family protein
MNIKNQDIFFISDLHLGHNNVIDYDNRPFNDVDEMNETIVRNWNNTVDKNSTVFYLGDLYMKMPFDKIKELVHSLNGKIYFILGNHDKLNVIKSLDRFEWISSMSEIYVDDEDGRGGNQQIIMCHFPLLVWNKHHKGSWLLQGHCHHNIKNDNTFYERKVMDVGCNGIDYTPISYKKVKEQMINKQIKIIDHH